MPGAHQQSPAAATGAPEDGALVVAARHGDRGAFARLYDRYARVVHGALLARVPRQEADDLTQDVFLSAMRRLDQLRDPAAFGGWLLAAARNRAAGWLRSRKPALALHSTDEPEAARTADGLTADDVMAVIARLPETYRETLVLRLVEGLTGPEIAERTGLTHGSVRVNLHRGMEMLRNQLSEGVQ